MEKISNRNDVGVIIFAERDSRGVTGSIKNPIFRMCIQRETTRRGSTEKGNSEEEKKKEGGRGVGGAGGEEEMRGHLSELEELDDTDE